MDEQLRHLPAKTVALIRGAATAVEAAGLRWVADASEVGAELVVRLAAAFGDETPRLALRSGLPAFALRAILERDYAAAAPTDLDPAALAGMGLRVVAPPQPVSMRHGLLRPRRRIAGLDWTKLEAALKAAHGAEPE